MLVTRKCMRFISIKRQNGLQYKKWLWKDIHYQPWVVSSCLVSALTLYSQTFVQTVLPQKEHREHKENQVLFEGLICSTDKENFHIFQVLPPKQASFIFPALHSQPFTLIVKLKAWSVNIIINDAQDIRCFTWISTLIFVFFQTSRFYVNYIHMKKISPCY